MTQESFEAHKSDDFQVNDYITILEWNTHNYQDLDGQGNVVTLSNKEHHHVGSLFKIIAIDRPFLGCLYIADNLKMLIDTRQCKLKKFSKEFVKAMLEENL